MPRLIVLVSPEEHRLVKRKAVAADMNVSNLIRKALLLKPRKHGVKTK